MRSSCSSIRRSKGSALAQRLAYSSLQVAAQASRSADRFDAAAQRALPDGAGRDAFLLGFAALAVGAAAFMNYRRGEA